MIFNRLLSLRDRVDGHLVAHAGEPLNLRVVGVLVVDEEGRLDAASVRIFAEGVAKEGKMFIVKTFALLQNLAGE